MSSVSRIKELVAEVIESKFKDKQLDECELTFKDLRLISESFVKLFAGMFHARVEYPSKQKEIINKLLVKNNLVSVENKVPILTDNAVITKLKEILILTNNHKDSRFQFFSSLLDFYNKKRYLSQKQKNAIINFDLQYTGKRWTAKPRGGR